MSQLPHMPVPHPKKSRRYAVLIMMTVLCVVLLKVGSALWFLHSIWKDEETRDLRDYPASLTHWEPKLIAHFPKSIPAHATNSAFIYQAGILQGGSLMQLRVQLPPEDLQQIDVSLGGANFPSEGITTPFRGDPALSSPQREPPPLAYAVSQDPNEFQLPSHFRVIRLVSDNRTGDWNHGQTAGIAISRKTNEILYWAEHW